MQIQCSACSFLRSSFNDAQQLGQQIGSQNMCITLHHVTMRFNDSMIYIYSVFHSSYFIPVSMPPTSNSSYHYVFVKNILRYWRCKVINVMLCHVVSCLFVAGLQNLWTAAVQRQAVALAFLISWPAFGLYLNPWGNADLTFKDIHGRSMFSGFDVAGLQFPLKGLLCRFHSVWRDTHNLPVDPIDASWMHHERVL